MSIYDFDNQPDRLSEHSVKWRETETDPELLPMWVADMDFRVFPEMTRAIVKFSGNSAFGYAYAPESLYEAIAGWENRRHGYEAKREHIVLVEGVVPAVSIAVQAFTQPGEAVLINTPAYPPFARTVNLNNRTLVCNSLVEKRGQYTIDFDILERQIVENNVKLFVFCSPHNPGGRVWTRDELSRVGELCRDHGVILVSDEIHQDIILFGNTHVPMNMVSPEFADFTVIVSSATKTFNIAGTKNSFAIIENEALRAKFQRQQLANNQHEINTLGLVTTEAAFRQGEGWLDELIPVLEKNVEYAVAYFAEHVPALGVMKPEGTYLMWLDFSAYGYTDEELMALLRDKARVTLNAGTTFGPEGVGHARLNIAAPYPSVVEACRRIATALAA